MVTKRQKFIAAAVIRIIDSGNTNLSDLRIAEALNGAAEFDKSYCDYHNSIPLGSRSEKLLLTAVRNGVTKHPRWQGSDLEKAARVVMTNLEFVWRKKYGDGMPVQEFKTNSNQSDEVIARSYQLLANCFNGRGNHA